MARSVQLAFTHIMENLSFCMMLRGVVSCATLFVVVRSQRLCVFLLAQFSLKALNGALSFFIGSHSAVTLVAHGANAEFVI